MGAWGFEPYQNDSVLDDLCLCRTQKDVSDFIYSGIGRVESDYINVYEVVAFLLESFGLYDGIMTKDSLNTILDAVRARKFSIDVFDAMGGYSIALLNAITIPENERKDMLVKAVETLKDYIKCNYGCEITDDADSDLVKNLIKIYKLGDETISSNFKAIKTVAITPSDVDWLLREYDNQSRHNFVEGWKKSYPDGITVVTDAKLAFNPATGNLMYKYFTPEGLIRSAFNVGAVCDILTILKPIDASEFFKKQYPKGFKAIKVKGMSLYKLVDLATGKELEHDIGEFDGNYSTAAFTLDTIKKMKNFTKITISKVSEPEIVLFVSRRKRDKKLYGYEVRRFGNRLDIIDKNELFKKVKNGSMVVKGMKFTADGRLVYDGGHK